MALGDPYASRAELEARLQRADDGTFASLLDDASRQVEQFTVRQFNKATVATARTFRPIDGCLTIVDDFHTITGLVIATDDDSDGTYETTWTTAHYELAPSNGIVSGEAGWPFWMINAAGNGHYFRLRNRHTVQVTAQWGWTTVPAGVKEATLAVAEQILGKSPGKVRSESIDGYSASYATDSENLGPFASAANYRRHEGFA